MSCEDVGEVLRLYLDGVLKDVADRRVDNHLDECPGCDFEVAVYEAARESLRRQDGRLSAETVRRLRAFGEEIA